MPRPPAERLRIMEAKARQVAADLGHQLAEFEKDGYMSKVTICVLCERVVAVDANPDGGMAGMALKRACDRVPQVVSVGLYCTCLACIIEKGA